MAQAGVLARSHDELLPRSPGGFGAGALLALLAHALLIAGLTFAVDWRTRDPEPISAELWANVPRALAPESAPPQSPMAAPQPTPTAEPTPLPRPLPQSELPKPTPPAPTPPKVEAPKPPPEPDIATERAEQRRLEAAQKIEKMEKARKLAVEKALEKEQEKAEAAAKEKAKEKAKEVAKEKVEADKKRQEQEAREATDKRLAQQREDYLKRVMGDSGKSTGTAGAAARQGAPSAAAMAAYTERLAALIRGNTIYSGSPPDNAPVVVEVRTAAGGTILSRRVLRSSGHPDWDDAVLRAVDRTGTLPANVDGKVPETLIIDFKPRE
jgi:colicin import membrane protein